jgi:hypothetical protein
MKRINSVFLIIALLFVGTNAFAQTKQTYKSNGTTYYYKEIYKTTGQPKVDRSSSAKSDFLKSKGYKKVPDGYQIDHIVPLSEGGADKPSNMQLITTEQHKIKTSSERSRNSTISTYRAPSYKSNSTYKSSNNNSTPSYSDGSGKITYAGSKGGNYYINSNGNKTHVKKE